MCDGMSLRLSFFEGWWWTSNRCVVVCPARLYHTLPFHQPSDFPFVMSSEILAYGMRAVSCPMFSPLSAIKWAYLPHVSFKFGLNRAIPICANEPQKRGKASEWGVKTWNFRPENIVIWCILCPFQVLELWGPCLRKCCNSLKFCLIDKIYTSRCDRWQLWQFIFWGVYSPHHIYYIYYN